ncbi:MAG: hypothetical protein DRJ01_09040 [Bacteroidetes bacterium]|nr:MAG: hypothetical protein DRJ01_09040 [Bacteroidota bacterium]
MKKNRVLVVILILSIICNLFLSYGIVILNDACRKWENMLIKHVRESNGIENKLNLRIEKLENISEKKDSIIVILTNKSNTLSD